MERVPAPNHFAMHLILI